MVNSLDEIGFVMKHEDHGRIICSEALYVMNNEAKALLKENTGAEEFTASPELNGEELKDLEWENLDLVVYGRTPMVYSAQCLRDNYMTCLKKTRGKGGNLSLKDRTGAEFPVKTLCPSCINVIYNSSTYSLIGMREMDSFTGFRSFVLRFTTETGEETRKVLEAFKEGKDLKGNYTRGHIRRGVE